MSPVGLGSLNSSGLYITPSTVIAKQSVTVVATSQADTTASSSTTITLLPSVSVSVNPDILALTSGQAVQLTATVTNTVDAETNQKTADVADASNPSVIWSALLGTISQDGHYTAPSNTGAMLTDTITATSIQYPAQYATAAVTVSSGLVGWWPLTEGKGMVAHDISGQGNDATWSGTPSSPTVTYYTLGTVGADAGYFNGIDNALTVGTQPVYGFTGPFTISMWINPVVSNSGEAIFARENFSNGGSNGYLLALYRSNPQFCLVGHDGTEVACANGSGAGPGVWTLLTAVYDGAKVSLYINGTLNSQAASAIPPPAIDGSLAFGIPEQGGQTPFKGSLEDLRVYNRALSPTEISSLYRTDIGPPNAPKNLHAFPGAGQIGLSWNSPTEGANVTDYTINYRQSGTRAWIVFPHLPSITTEQVITGLVDGTSYDCEVVPVSATGEGLASDIVSATPTATPPAITLSVTPRATSAMPGATTTFAAVVSNALNPSVTWSARYGMITVQGLYTAPPNTSSSALTDTITATSIQNPTKSATAIVNVLSGLVGWWPLTEGKGQVAYDMSGQGNNGIWAGTPSSPNGTYYTATKMGTTVGYFNGTDNALTIGAQSVYNFMGPFTISMWINPASVSIAGIFARETFANNGMNGYLLALYPSAPQFCLVANDGTKVACANGSGVDIGVWTLLTTVYDGANMSVYVNGTLNSRVTSVVAPPSINGTLIFGSPEQGGQNPFTGSLEDIRVYNRALSGSEILTLYNSDVGSPSAATNLESFPGNGQIALSWKSPSGGAIVNDYTINYRLSGTETWTVFSHNPSVMTAQVITDLKNGISYDFEVTPVSANGVGTASNIVSATPMSSVSSVYPSDDDEFIGPFPSWLNVKTNFGAVGDGVADDTMAFQYAFSALESTSRHASVLYIPAGTYNISSSLKYISTNCASCSGKSIIGESPANTILKWRGGATGSAMITLDGINRMQFNRLTLDGSGAQITLVNETMHLGCCYDGSNEYTDDVFENAAIGLQGGDNAVGCCSAETKVDRDTFENLTEAGISLEDWNALDWYVRYCTFAHNKYGVTNAYGEGGAIHLDHNLFEYNDVDAYWGNGSTQSYTYNTSYHSGIFLLGSPFNNSSILIGNAILEPQRTAISIPGIGPLTLIANTIEGSITTAQSSDQTVTFADGSKSTPSSYIASTGNTFVSASPFAVQNVTYGVNEIGGGLTSISDAVVSASDIHAKVSPMPGPLPNYHRAIYDVPQGASGDIIQGLIYQAIAENSGNRPVVHLPWGEYSVSSTIIIPGGSDVQIVGDNMQTVINWVGSTSSPVFAFLPQSHAEMRNLMINANSASSGIQVQGYDRPGDRIYANFVANGAPGSLHNLVVSNFDNTFVQMDDFAHAGLTNATTSSVLVTGGPLSQKGHTTPGYTGLFMGSSSNNTSSYRVDGGGTLVLSGFWYEQGGPRWLDLDNATGNFIAYEDNVAVNPGGGLPSLAAKNFTGNLTIVNSGIANGQLSLAGSTRSNALLLGNEFSPQAVNALVQPPFITDTNANSGSQVASINSSWSSGSILYTVPDEISPGTPRNTFIRDSLIQLASYKDAAVTDLPSGNEDVRLVDLIVNNGINSFDFESVAATASSTDQISFNGDHGSFGMAATFSRPTSPQTKQANKNRDGRGIVRPDIIKSLENRTSRFAQ